MFPDSPTRTKIDLSGSWNWSLDGSHWMSVGIPGAYDYTGRVTFMRNFEMKPEMLEKYAFSLVAYGINYQSEILINGSFIGRHIGGYTSFVLPIPANCVQAGSQNMISVSVDNELTPKTTIPLRQQVGGWKTYGGIFRDIYILATPKVFVDNTHSRTELTTDSKGEVKSATISVQADVTDWASGANGPGGWDLQIEIDDKLNGDLLGRSGLVPLAPEQNKTVSVDAEVTIASPKLWSPESPDLYVMKCQLVRLVNKEVVLVDQCQSDLGIREMRWKEGHLVVNNAAVMLKGLLWQEDHSTFGSAMTYESLEHDVAAIKAVGANLIRFLAPPHPYMLNLCDRYGILVMEDAPVIGVPGETLMKDYYQDLAASYVKEMVERDSHHACVLAWGIGDEVETGGANACDYVNAVRNVVRSGDGRAVYFASSSSKEPCYDKVDLIAVNTYGADPKICREFLRQVKQEYPSKPIVVARYGRDVEPGNHNGYSDPLSGESQARYAMQFFDVMKEAKVAGGVLWSFADWRTDRAALSAHSKNPYLRSMGIVGYDRDKRVAYDVVRSLFNGEKIQALPVGNYSSNAPIIFVISGFLTLISFAFIYNGNRRFREGVNRSLLRTYNFFADVRDQHILTYLNSLSLAAIVSITLATLLASIFTHYSNSLLLDNFLSQILSDRLKEWLIRLVWHPLNFILVVSGLFFGGLLTLSVLIRISSMMVRARVYFYHAFSITMWSMLPFVLLTPLAMIMFRLMETPFYVLPMFGLIGVIILWAAVRLLKGISIIYDVFPAKVYALGVLALLLVSAALYTYLDYANSTSTYLRQMMQSMKNSA